MSAATWRAKNPMDLPGSTGASVWLHWSPGTSLPKRERWKRSGRHNRYCNHLANSGLQPSDFKTSRQIAEKSNALLKNEGGILPLPPDLKRIAVIGPRANNARLLQGDFHYPSHLQVIAELAGARRSTAKHRLGS